MSDQWRDVVEQEQRQRKQRIAHDKYHGTQEMYRLEQDAAREGHLPASSQPASEQPGLLAKIARTIKGMLGRG